MYQATSDTDSDVDYNPTHNGSKLGHTKLTSHTMSDVACNRIKKTAGANTTGRSASSPLFQINEWVGIQHIPCKIKTQDLLLWVGKTPQGFTLYLNNTTEQHNREVHQSVDYLVPPIFAGISAAPRAPSAGPGALSPLHREVCPLDPVPQLL